MFSRILVAYDDSPGARRALDVAVDLMRLWPDVELVAAAVEAHLPHYGATVGEYEEEREFEARRCQHWLQTASAIAAQGDRPQD